MPFLSQAAKLSVILMLCIFIGSFGCSIAKNSNSFSCHGVSLNLPDRWSARGDMIPPRPLYEGKDLELRKTSKMYTNKPNFYNMPRHIRILFSYPNGPANKPDELKAEISIHSIEEYSHIFEPDGDAKSMIEGFNRVWQIATERMTHKINQELLIIPPAWGDQSVVVGFKQIEQKYYKGFRFITQLHQEASFMGERGLFYIFQGISTDKKKYVLATFPIALDGLAKASDLDHLGFSIRNYDEFAKVKENYYLKAARWLEENEGKMQPAPATLDDILRSVQIIESL
jgi:hypothetical protein